MAVHVTDLPADVRRRIEAEHGTTKRAKPSRTPGGNHTPGHCHTPGCNWQGTDRHDKCKRKTCDCFHRHMTTTGHARFEMHLEAPHG